MTFDDYNHTHEPLELEMGTEHSIGEPIPLLDELRSDRLGNLHSREADGEVFGRVEPVQRADESIGEREAVSHRTPARVAGAQWQRAEMMTGRR